MKNKKVVPGSITEEGKPIEAVVDEVSHDIIKEKEPKLYAEIEKLVAMGQKPSFIALASKYYGASDFKAALIESTASYIRAQKRADGSVGL